MSTLNVGTLEAVFRLKDELSPAVKNAEKAFDSADKAAKKLASGGLKNMSSSLEHSTSKAGKFADTLGKTSTTLARSADLFGLPVGALRALDDAADVAELGFVGLGKGALTASVGVKTFYLALLGPIAAAAALGVAIGGFLNKFEAVRNFADKATAGLNDFLAALGVFESKSGAGRGPFSAGELDKVKAAHDQVSQSVIASIRADHAKGMELADLRDKYDKYKNTSVEVEKLLERGIAKEDRHAAALKKSGEEAARLAEKAREAAEAMKKAEIDIMLQGVKQDQEEVVEMQEKWNDRIRQMTERILEAREAQEAEVEWAKSVAKVKEELADEIAEANRRALEHTFALAGATQDLGATIGGMVGGAVGALGGLINVYAALSKEAQKAAKELKATQKATVLVQGAQQAFSSGSVLGGAMAGASAGAMFGPIGAGVGAVAGGLLGFFGGRSKEKKQLEQMRKDFIAAAGGVEVLAQRAKEAGVSIDAMLKAKKVKDFEAAIKDLNGALEIQTQAQEELDAAIQKYGFSIEELGPKFKQQKLDEMAAQLVKEYNLLIASGIDVTKVTEKMGPALNDYVKTAMAAGVAIPESMRPALQKLLEMGRLTDAAGNKLTSLEGLTFTEALTESMSRAVDQMQLLVEAIRKLAGMPPINIPINVPNVNLPGAGVGSTPPHMPHLGNFASGIDMIAPHTGTAVIHQGERLTVTKPGEVRGEIKYAPVFHMPIDARGMNPEEVRRAVRSAMDGSNLRSYSHFLRATKGIRN